MKASIRQISVFFLLNLPISWLIAWRYLSAAQVDNGLEALYVGLVFAGHLGFILLLAALPLWLLALLPRKVLALSLIVAMSAAQLLLLLDTFVFAIYRFHFSGFVWDLILNAGTDVFQFSLQAWLMALAALLVAVLLEALLWWLAGKALKLKHYGQALALSFVAFLGFNLWHAWADANYRTDVTAYTRYFPMFYPLTALDFMTKMGLVDSQAVRDQVQWQLGKSSKQLNYPASSIQCQAPAQPDNLLIILVDTLRADMLTLELMPNLYAFAHKPNGLSLPEHFSGGNSTKAGVFSLFYGLPVSYWNAFTSAQQPPVLMQKLKEQGYDFQVYSSATLVSPAFDRNIFAGLTDVTLYTAGGEPWQRDRTITDKWQQWLPSAGDKPFFGFLFYDAVHGYSVPPDFPRIEPYWQSINHVELNKDFDRTPYFNRYKTAARYVDTLLGEVLNGLEQSGALAHTLVLITGDHGESFNEHGKNYWGHGSNYSPEQTQVPVVMHFPSAMPKPVARRTSHADLPVTLLETLFRCQADEYAYSLGTSIFKARNKDWVVSGSYLGEAVLFPDFYIDIGLSGRAQSYFYNLDPAPEKTVPAAESLEVMQAFSRFYH